MIAGLPDASATSGPEEVPIMLCHGARSPGSLAAMIALALLLHINGCAGWRSVGREELVREVQGHRPTRIRVVDRDSLFEIAKPSVRSDSLLGVAKEPKGSKPVAVALADVDSAAVPKTYRKGMRVVAATALALVIVGIIATNRPPRFHPAEP